MDNPKIFLDLVTVIVTMLLSLTVREYVRARVAMALGDPTPKEAGRDTLSPTSHIDAIGTLLLPVLLTISQNSVYFGWGKPVPISPTRFRRDVPMRQGTLYVAISGPIASLALATLVAIGLGLVLRGGVRSEPVEYLAVKLVQVNVGLAVFNLLPVPPLDGARIVWALLDQRRAEAFERMMAQLGMFAFLLIILVGGRIVRPPIVALVSLLLNKVMPFFAGV